MQQNYDIIIVGCGIAGSAMAVELGELMAADTPLRNARIALIESANLPSGWPPVKADVQGYDRRVSALTAASCEQLKQLGVWPAIAQRRVCGFDAMDVWDGIGTARVTFDASSVGAEFLGCIVENRLLVASLVNKLRTQNRIDILDGKQVVALECGDGRSGSVAIQLASGQLLRAELVVAADGAQSGLRELLGMTTKCWDYGHDAIVCTVRSKRAHGNIARQCFTERGPLAFLPLANGVEREADSDLCSIVWSVECDHSGALMALSDSEFMMRLADAFEHELGEVLEVSQRQCFPLRQMHAENYVQPGFALVADAAHTIHPLAGQGINLGLADVRCLVEVVQRAATRGLCFGDLENLQRYQRQRKTDNLAMMAAVESFKQLFRPLPLPLLLARNLGMKLVNRQQWIKRNIIKYAMGLV